MSKNDWAKGRQKRTHSILLSDYVHRILKEFSKEYKRTMSEVLDCALIEYIRVHQENI